MVMETEERTTTGTPESPAPSLQPDTSPAAASPVVEQAAAQVAAPAAEQTIPVAQPVAPAIIPTSPFTPPIENLSPEVQEYVTRIEQENQGAREQQERQVLDQTVTQWANQLAQQHNLLPEQAQPIAKIIGDILYKNFNGERTLRAQFRAAISYGKQFGVDPMQLLDVASPQDMRRTAERLQATASQASELTRLRDENSRLKKGTVPAQTFAQGAQPGAGTGLQGDALQSAWLKHEREQPDRPNPYDAAYRAMVNS